MLEAVDDEQKIFVSRYAESSCPAVSLTPSVSAIAGITRFGSVIAATVTKWTPFGKSSSSSAAAWSASLFCRSTRPGERDRAHIWPPQQLDNIADLWVAPNERRRLYRQVRWPVPERSERWKPAGQVLQEELEQALRLGKILQSVLAEVEEHDSMFVCLE